MRRRRGGQLHVHLSRRQRDHRAQADHGHGLEPRRHLWRSDPRHQPVVLRLRGQRHRRRRVGHHVHHDLHPDRERGVVAHHDLCQRDGHELLVRLRRRHGHDPACHAHDYGLEHNTHARRSCTGRHARSGGPAQQRPPVGRHRPELHHRVHALDPCGADALDALQRRDGRELRRRLRQRHRHDHAGQREHRLGLARADHVRDATLGDAVERHGLRRLSRHLWRGALRLHARRPADCARRRPARGHSHTPRGIHPRQHGQLRRRLAQRDAGRQPRAAVARRRCRRRDQDLRPDDDADSRLPLGHWCDLVPRRFRSLRGHGREPRDDGRRHLSGQRHDRNRRQLPAADVQPAGDHRQSCHAHRHPGQRATPSRPSRSAAHAADHGLRPRRHRERADRTRQPRPRPGRDTGRLRDPRLGRGRRELRLLVRHGDLHHRGEGLRDDRVGHADGDHVRHAAIGDGAESERRVRRRRRPRHVRVRRRRRADRRWHEAAGRPARRDRDVHAD